MALTGYFCCGAECQITASATPSQGGPNSDDGHWDQFGASPPVLDTTVVDPDGGVTSYKIAGGGGATLNKGFTPLPNTVALHFRVRADANNATGYQPFVGNFSVSFWNVFWNSTGFSIQIGASSIVFNPDGASAINQWHTVDAMCNVSTGTWTMKCKIDGGTEFTATFAHAATNATQMVFGDNLGAATGNLWIDNIVITTATADYPIQRGGITGFKVNTVSGTHNTPADFQDQNSVALVNGDNTGANLQDLPADTTTFTGQVTAGGAAYAEYVYATAAETRIPLTVEQAVSVLANNVTGANQQGLLSDGVSTRVIEGLVTINVTTVKTQSKNHSTPPSGGSWTAALFQALRLRWGFSTTAGANQARVSNTFLEAYFALPPVTGTGTWDDWWLNPKSVR